MIVSCYEIFKKNQFLQQCFQGWADREGLT